MESGRVLILPVSLAMWYSQWGKEEPGSGGLRERLGWSLAP